jgi:hypothetical protein
MVKPNLQFKNVPKLAKLAWETSLAGLSMISLS